MTFTKAVIVNMDAKLPLPIAVMFNPPDYSLQSTIEFAEVKVPGLPSSILQYVGSGVKMLDTELFFDTTDTGVDVRTRTAAISELVNQDPEKQAPPQLLLLWGSLVFPCFLVDVNERFERFNALGMPLRARLKVKFKGHDALTSLVAKLPVAQVAAASGYVVKAGQDLAAIAAEKYGDSAQWRRIAQANGIDDPRAPLVGRVLQLPGLA